MLEWVIWAGAAMTVMGLGGLVWCILIVARAKRAGLSDDQMKAKLQRVVALNMAALFVSALGLMLVLVGILLR